MPSQTLNFKSSPEWVLEFAKEELKSRKGVGAVTVNWNSKTYTGSIKIQASSEAHLNSAVTFLRQHDIFKCHFKD